MECLPQRLKKLRSKFGWTQQFVADKLSITVGTYSGYERGYRKPDADMLRKLATLFNTTTDYILGRSDDPTPKENISQLIPGAYPAGKMVKLPVLGVIRAGEPILAVENIIGWEEVPEEDIKDGEYFFLRVTGDSMKDANMPDGSYVLIRKQNYIDDGKIAVVLVNGEEATVKRVKKMDGKVLLIPANSMYEPQIYNVDEVQIIGKVVEIKIKVD